MRIPEVCESVSRSRESIITAKRHMRKGEKKRFTKFTNDDDEKRREKKKKSTFPRARDAARSWPGYFLFDSADGHPHCASVEGARFSSQPPSRGEARGRRTAVFYSEEKKKTGTNRDEKKKRSVGRTARSSNFSSAPWSSALGTPLGSARNTAMNPNGIPADLRIRSRTSCPGCCVR